MATQTTTETTTARGIQLPCPRCGESRANLLLHLVDLETCTCAECETEFALDEVRAILAAWAPVLAWIDTAPATD